MSHRWGFKYKNGRRYKQRIQDEKHSSSTYYSEGLKLWQSFISIYEHIVPLIVHCRHSCISALRGRVRQRISIQSNSCKPNLHTAPSAWLKLTIVTAWTSADARYCVLANSAWTIRDRFFIFRYRPLERLCRYLRCFRLLGSSNPRTMACYRTPAVLLRLAVLRPSRRLPLLQFDQRYFLGQRTWAEIDTAVCTEDRVSMRQRDLYKYIRNISDHRVWLIILGHSPLLVFTPYSNKPLTRTLKVKGFNPPLLW